MTRRIHLHLACRALASGGVVGYPTEAVWGIGCEPLNRHACARLLALKRRGAGKGLIVIGADWRQLAPLLAPRTVQELEPVLATWPGPSTWLLPAAPGVPGWLTGDHDTLAVRVTAHPRAAALCQAYGGPIVSTSANLARRPPARSALQLRRRLGGQLDYILPGATGGLARPTPIRDWRTGRLVRS